MARFLSNFRVIFKKSLICEFSQCNNVIFQIGFLHFFFNSCTFRPIRSAPMFRAVAVLVFKSVRSSASAPAFSISIISSRVWRETLAISSRLLYWKSECECFEETQREQTTLLTDYLPNTITSAVSVFHRANVTISLMKSTRLGAR